MKDLLITNGKIMERYIFDKIENKVHFLSEIYRLRLSVRTFKHLLQDNIPQNIIYSLPLEPKFCQGNLTVQIHDKKTKFYYKELLKHICKPVAFTYWNDIIQHKPHISQVMKNKLIEIKENKIAEFNYKFMHGIVACGKMLSRWKPEFHDKCSLCNTDETQEHIIYECPMARNIWTKIGDQLEMTITLENITFGVDDRRQINNLISQTSFSIHKYWIIRINEKKVPSEIGLKRMIQYDLKYKSLIMDKVNEPDIAELYKQISQSLR